MMQVGQLLNKNKDVASAVSGGLASIIKGIIPSKIDDSEILKK